MHLTAKNHNYSYKLMESKLTVTDKERDFEIMVRFNEVSTQCAFPIENTHRMLDSKYFPLLKTLELDITL